MSLFLIVLLALIACVIGLVGTVSWLWGSIRCRPRRRVALRLNLRSGRKTLAPEHYLGTQHSALSTQHYPIDSQIASIVVRRQVYIGVSRRVYFDDSVSRSSCTRSRNSPAFSASKATTKS